MAEIHFTSHLRNLVPDGPLSAAGATVGEALVNLLAAQPHVRGYVLDDRGCLRKHVCIFADGERLAHDGALARRIGPDSNVLRTDGVIYAALKHGHFGAKLHRSDDAGATWCELAAPAFLADAADAPSLFQIWTMETGGRTHPDRLWIGAIPAGLFRSDDRGE